MLFMMSHYFSTLIKRVFLLLLFCTFGPVLLLAHHYPLSTSIDIFINSIALALPWFFWFHQAMYTGFTTPKTLSTRISYTLMSTLLSTILILFFFPISQRNLDHKIFDFKINEITPSSIALKGPIISSDLGTLVIDPNGNLKGHNLFAHPDSKALLINSNYLSFQEIRTNKQAYILDKAHSFSSSGYYPQKGEAIFSFEGSQPSLPQYTLGQEIVQYWFDNIRRLNQHTKNLYKNTGFTLSSDTKDIPTNVIPFSQQIINIFRLTICFLSIFTLASLLGVIATFGQSFLGSLVLVFLSSLCAPFFTEKMIDLSLKLHTLQPQFSILIINAILMGILYLCSIIALTIKSKIKGVPH